MEILSTTGPRGLTIEELCHRAERSKGSFYFNFGSMKSYKVALLQFWEKTHTERVETLLAEQASVAVRRRALPDIASQLDSRVERAIREWAHHDSQARALIRTVDDRRISFVADLISETNQIGLPEARKLATIEYAAFLGFQQLRPDAEEAWRFKRFEEVVDLISPGIVPK